MPENIEIQYEPSSFHSHTFSSEINGTNYNFRILKMIDSVFIYFGCANNEIIEEIGVAMPSRLNSMDIMGTTALGPQLGCDSQELAIKLSKRLKKQVYLSCNVAADRMLRPLIETRLSEEIKTYPQYF